MTRGHVALRNASDAGGGALHGADKGIKSEGNLPGAGRRVRPLRLDFQVYSTRSPTGPSHTVECPWAKHMLECRATEPCGWARAARPWGPHGTRLKVPGWLGVGAFAPARAYRTISRSRSVSCCRRSTIIVGFEIVQLSFVALGILVAWFGNLFSALDHCDRESVKMTRLVYY